MWTAAPSMAAIALSLAGSAPAAETSLVIALGQDRAPGPVSVPVSTPDGDAIAAAAVTAVFDTASLDVSASSDFFAPFAEQFDSAGVFLPPGSSVTISGVLYDQPLAVRPVADGAAVAGVRILPAPSGPADLFTLHFTLKAGASPGIYPVTLRPTVVSEPDAGYDPGGESIDPVTGQDFEAGSFSIIIAPHELAAVTTPGWARFSTDDTDSDGDGLPDSWEIAHFGNLDTTDGSGDSDGDGWIDAAEYFLSLDPHSSDGEGSIVTDPEPDGDSYHVYFPIRPDHAGSVDVHWTSDLAAWSTDGVTLTPRPDLPSGPDWIVIEAAIPAGPDTAPRIAVRLQMTTAE